MSLKIDIQPRLLHFKQPAGTSRGVYRERQTWIIEAYNTDCPNIKGLGESAPLPDLSLDASPYYFGTLRRFADLTESLDGIDWESLRPYPSMLFGLETALLDLRNGGRGILYDTPFTRGEEGILINGLVWMGQYDEMLRRLEEKIRGGFHCVKLKIGAIDFEKELDLVRRIRASFSKDVMELRLDANGGFTPDIAPERLAQLAPYDIHSIEQPIRQGQWQEMSNLCRLSPIPIALDEELIGVNTAEEKRSLLDTVRPWYIILKPSLHGGMLGCREWITLANERNIGSWITSALESNIGLNAIAQFASDVYGAKIPLPQGLGTGALFTDNIEMGLQVRGERLWKK